MDKLELILENNAGMLMLALGLWFGLGALGEGIAKFGDHLEDGIRSLTSNIIDICFINK